MGWELCASLWGVERKVFCLMTLPSTKIHYKTFIYLTTFQQTLVLKAKAKLYGSKQHSIYHLTINTMFNLHVWQLPHFVSSIWTKILKQNMFHTVYNYQVNLYSADEELWQIIALQYHDSTRKKAKCRASVHT